MTRHRPLPFSLGAVACAALLACTPALADESALAARIEQMQAELNAMKAELQKLKAEKAAAPPAATPAAAATTAATAPPMASMSLSVGPPSTSETRAREPRRGSRSFRVQPSCSQRILIACTGSSGKMGNCLRSYASTSVADSVVSKP